LTPGLLLLSTDDLIERLNGNEELARRMAGAFVDDMPGQLIALAKAINNTDVKATMFAAHSIRGMAANVGCPAVRDLASMVEKLGESGALAQASGVLQEFTTTFEAVRPSMQRFCSGN
jgi:HPt (histidine-containing phosphotransfer) domain-containing protein